ncbi:MAG: CoA transferase [Actinobacteria bacterium]|nr:CoA transferase [Actinomycetota bacterium]
MLAAYRVVELGAFVAGPGAGGVMADWGADVIKVETPSGDPMRRIFAVGSGHLQPQSPPFDLDNRGKRSVVLDLRSAGDRDNLNRLIGTADVFLTNLRPDAVERLGLDHQTLLAAHPRLVYASVTGYGLDGPDRLRPGYDVGAFNARTGLANLQGEVFDEPANIRSGLGDHVTSMTALTGILAALLHRERTGKGQLVATSLLRAGIYSLGWDLGIQLRFDKLAPSQRRTEAANPMINSYRGADGKWFWLLGLEADRHWPNVVKALGEPAALADDRFADARGRRKNAADCIAALDAIFATRSREEWTAIFDAHDVWWAPVQTPAEVLADPQAHAAGAFVDVPAGQGDSPAHRGIATPIDFSAAPVTAGPVPALGQHTAEVLAELDNLSPR